MSFQMKGFNFFSFERSQKLFYTSSDTIFFLFSFELFLLYFNFTYAVAVLILANLLLILILWFPLLFHHFLFPLCFFFVLFFFDRIKRFINCIIYLIIVSLCFILLLFWKKSNSFILISFWKLITKVSKKITVSRTKHIIHLLSIFLK